MRRLLALDTSTWWGSVALVEHGPEDAPRIVAEAGERVTDSHAELLLGWIERALADAGWSRNDLDAYAATRGPGSFTGIRVGLGTLRGLALATNRPAVGVTTLAALAHARAGTERDRFPVMDAGRGELYAARYAAGSAPPRELEPPCLAPAEAILARVLEAGGELITGPGTEVPAEHASGAVAGPRRLAGCAGQLAALRLGTAEPPDALAPLYIRPPDALLKRKRRG